MVTAYADSPMSSLASSHPDPDALHPMAGVDSVVFLRPLLETRDPRPTNISVGAFSYYADFNDPTRFFDENVRYHFPFSQARLDIGRFCALAHGTTFIMSDANHVLDGVSTYPFPIFGGAWAEAQPIESTPFPFKGDTVVGSDVWFGYESVVMPGVKIGHGAIIGARAVVSRDVPPYGVVVGNPARLVKRRFDDATIERLLSLTWWNWPDDGLAAAVPLLVRGDVDALEAMARNKMTIKTYIKTL